MPAGLVRYHVAMSLDGFIAPPDGSVDWLQDFAGGSGFADFIQTIGGIITGRDSFETERSFGPWSYDTTPVTVMTNRPVQQPPKNVVAANADPADALDALRKRTESGDIWLFGGGIVAGAFLDAGLIDRIELTTVPFVLGTGRPLFQGATKTRRLKLLTIHTEGSVLQSVYLPDRCGNIACSKLEITSRPASLVPRCASVGVRRRTSSPPIWLSNKLSRP